MQNKNLLHQVLLNRFEVESFIAAGGMSAVYKVWDVQRSAYLAMKVLQLDEVWESAGRTPASAYRRFQREAEHLKRLTHPNIVPFYGLYSAGDLHFLLEGFVNGPSLKAIFHERRGKPLALPDALAFLRALCASLGYAHAQGVVHCDVKPSNVLIDTGGTIYLTDFGIAQRVESITDSYAAAGTPYYMAPEQIRGDTLTPAVDIYSLGVLLFEMLTGRKPFAGTEAELEDSFRLRGGPGPNLPSANRAERLRAAHLLLPPPDPRLFNPAIPAELVAVMRKAMAKEPQERFETTTQFFQAAVAAAGLTAIPERVPPADLLGSAWMPAAESPPPGQPRKTSLLRSTTCLPLVAGVLLLGLLLLGGLVAAIVFRRDLPFGQQARLPLPPALRTAFTPTTAVGAVPEPQNTPATPAGSPEASPPLPVVTVPLPVTGNTPPSATPLRSAPTLLAPTLSAPTLSAPLPATTTTPTAPVNASAWTDPKDGMRLMRVPAGPFWMGSNQSPWTFEEPRHKVTLNEFWIDQTEITNAMFRRFVEQTGYETRAEQVGWGFVYNGKQETQVNGADWQHPFGPDSNIIGQDKNPVVQVSWADAQAYCAWAGRRLPTEAEWEKAARGTDGRLYPWGDQIDCAHANYAGCTGGITAVDAYPAGASPYGVLDMSGNVWQWVADWYQADYYTRSPADNPTGPATGERKVHRGGAWYNFNLQVQAPYRYGNIPTWTFSSVGIRCAKTR